MEVIETQETGHIDEHGNSSYLFRKMAVMASKHYIARNVSGTLYSKGVLYVRRTGSKVMDY
jgi:hypothetical protein